MMSQSDVNSSGRPLAVDNQKGRIDRSNNGNPAIPNLGRQSSIYALTLDEFQHTVCENGKNFGSMNMDEFLSSIWSAEENQGHHGNQQHDDNSCSGGGMMIAKQTSLARQGSLTLPEPLCRKTVDEVWTEIQRTQHPSKEAQQQRANSNSNSNPTQRQPTFGEMTLEDFLVKAGVVREPPLSVGPPALHHHPYGFAPSLVTQPIMGPGYQASIDDFATNERKRNNGFPCYGGTVTSAAGLLPVSPVSPDGMCGTGQVDNSVAQYGLDVLRGRKRIIDGPVEKVVERRQRRMIKNRESAARSRARKQAYTVELEAELNQLREENTQLKQALKWRGKRSSSVGRSSRNKHQSAELKEGFGNSRR
ncbi:hypothetical protein RND81_05G002300 [Saponaria officinalis]|uniref:BZIP domain-containing protein n=1 Tax=Saponaria officinalis TaxID=3572 RepID=A0AAW1KQ67_SAPOF